MMPIPFIDDPASGRRRHARAADCRRRCGPESRRGSVPAAVAEISAVEILVMAAAVRTGPEIRLSLCIVARWSCWVVDNSGGAVRVDRHDVMVMIQVLAIAVGRREASNAVVTEPVGDRRAFEPGRDSMTEFTIVLAATTVATAVVALTPA